MSTPQTRLEAARLETWSFASRIRRLRRDCGLTQLQAASAAGLSRHRYVAFENGRARPGVAELGRLSRALLATPEELRAGTDWSAPRRRGRPAGSRFFQPRFRAKQARMAETAVFIRRALDLHASLTRRLLAEIRRSQPDLPLVRIFLREVVCDSVLEALFLLMLLAVGARPVWVSPLRAGFRIRPVVDGNRVQAGDQRVPALELEASGMRLLLIPQIRIQVKGGAPRLDCLLGARLPRRRSTLWLAIEVNGPAHVPQEDDERRDRHGLLEIRLGQDALIHTDWVKPFLEKVGALLGPTPVSPAPRGRPDP